MLKFQPFQGSAVFRFVDPDTGYPFTAPTRSELITQIIIYRTNNQLEDIENLGLVVDNFICTLPENAGKCIEVEGWENNYQEIARGAMKLFKNWLFKTFVPQNIAEARAEQCVQCPENIMPEGYDTFAAKAALSMRGGRSTSHDPELGMCAACGCINRATVFFGGKFPKYEEEQMERLRAVGCWKLQNITK